MTPARLDAIVMVADPYKLPQSSFVLVITPQFGVIVSKIEHWGEQDIGLGEKRTTR